MSVNKVILIGRAGKDPDVRTLDGGAKVASLSFATTDKAYTLQNGTQVPERTEWHNLIFWNKTVTNATAYTETATTSTAACISATAISTGITA